MNAHLNIIFTEMKLTLWDITKMVKIKYLSCNSAEYFLFDLLYWNNWSLNLDVFYNIMVV